jgi:hypothetical protein
MKSVSSVKKRLDERIILSDQHLETHCRARRGGKNEALSLCKALLVGIDVHEDDGRRLLSFEAPRRLERDLPFGKNLIAKQVVGPGWTGQREVAHSLTFRERCFAKAEYRENNQLAMLKAPFDQIGNDMGNLGRSPASSYAMTRTPSPRRAFPISNSNGSVPRRKRAILSGERWLVLARKPTNPSLLNAESSLTSHCPDGGITSSTSNPCKPILTSGADSRSG